MDKLCSDISRPTPKLFECAAHVSRASRHHWKSKKEKKAQIKLQQRNKGNETAQKSKCFESSITNKEKK